MGRQDILLSAEIHYLKGTDKATFLLQSRQKKIVPAARRFWNRTVEMLSLPLHHEINNKVKFEYSIPYLQRGEGKKQTKKKNHTNPTYFPNPHLQKTNQTTTHTTKPLAKKPPNILYKAEGYQIASV